MQKVENNFKRICLGLISSVALLVLGCTPKDQQSADSGDQGVTEEGVSEPVGKVAPGDLIAINDPVQDEPEEELAEFVGDERFGELFEEVVPILEQTRDLVERKIVQILKKVSLCGL